MVYPGSKIFLIFKLEDGNSFQEADFTSVDISAMDFPKSKSEWNKIVHSAKLILVTLRLLFPLTDVSLIILLFLLK